MFVVAFAALIGLIGSLLWYTDWAEERLVAPKRDVEADPR
jgi:hypothetical protein